MINIRKAADRGKVNLGWLDSKHTFSFGDYYDPAHMGFGHLRVINDDTVEPGQGFGTHGHKDMEIISYIIDGALEHKDSMGNGAIMRQGEVQRMTAGTGVTHSEFNSSPHDRVHFLQIWILPESPSLRPGYEQKNFPDDAKRDQLRLVASRDGRDGALTVHQNVDIYASQLSAGTTLTHTLGDGRQAWLQIVHGDVRVDDAQLTTGDGAAITGQSTIAIAAGQDSEFILFDVPA